MSRTDTSKHYDTFKHTFVEQGRTGLLAAIGAGDAAVDRARSVVGSLRSRAEALPGEAQVQADLAVKEARTRAEQARARAAQTSAEARVRAGQAGDAAVSARNAVTHAAATVRPETVVGTVTNLVGAARSQAVETLAELADRGEKVVDELRSQPVLRRVAGRTERTVDLVADAAADTVGDVLAETSGTVDAASDRVTSVAQKTKARAGKAIDEAEQGTEAAAASAKRAASAASAPVTNGLDAPAVDTAVPVDKPAGNKTPAKKAADRMSPTTASTATLPDPTAVPAKSSTVTGDAH